MVTAPVDRLLARYWTARPILAQADWPADAHVDYLSDLRRILFAADLFHRLQVARGRIRMERAAPGGCAAEWRAGRTARPNLCIRLFPLEPKIHARKPAKVRDAAR